MSATIGLIPPFRAGAGGWTVPGIVSWWDMSVMLMLGGIPWNCYFQRVLSCRTPMQASEHSILAGLLTIALTVPPALLGMTAFVYWGPGGLEPASAALPRLLQDLAPHPVMLLGLAAIIGAVTSSFSASILSAGSMLSWNVCQRMLTPRASVARLKTVLRLAILGFGATAVVLALWVKSVASLWLFTGDLVFVLLLPQLVMALYDPRANRFGSAAALLVSLLLRLGGGVAIETDEGLLGFGAFLPYGELGAGLWSGAAHEWYDAIGASLFPVRIVAALAGLVLIPVVSRLTGRWDPPRALRAIGK
jgi:high affinity choline transporter 7